ncbi:hypothetical protein [Sinomonas susongensis]|uniref:hypothetical protein n=1 Tax=Sinomonas susongensis TaxID=1324851 RepID=UPI001109302D|nr:hypothetical protein [Sinomonas susongensis]
MTNMPSLKTDPDGLHEHPKRSTSAVLWTAAVLATGAFLWVRTQQLHPLIVERVHKAPELSHVTNEGVLELSVGIGSFLAFVLSIALAAIYFSLASVLETRVLPGVRGALGNLTIGVLGTSSIVSLVGLQAVASFGQLVSIKGQWYSFAFVALVGVTAPFLFTACWDKRPALARLLTFGLSLGIAAGSLLF